MSLLRSLADRVLPPVYRQPPPPTTGEEFDYSVILSANDDVRPTPRLLELAIGTAEIARDMRLAAALGAERVPERVDCWPGEPYRFVAALTQAMKPKMVVMMGTHMYWWEAAIRHALPKDAEVRGIPEGRWDEVAHVIKWADMIVTSDLGPDGGHSARWAMVGGTGILVVDGIRRWEMLKDWRGLPFPKLDVTSIAHWCGTGLADLQGEKA